MGLIRPLKREHSSTPFLSSIDKVFESLLCKQVTETLMSTGSGGGGGREGGLPCKKGRDARQAFFDP